MMYRFGLGTETDYKKAVEWLFKASTEDFRTVSTILESCIENGWGVMKNLEVANYWLEKAGQPTISLNSQSQSVVLNEDSEQTERFENAMIDLKAIRYKPAFRAFQKLAERPLGEPAPFGDDASFWAWNRDGLQEGSISGYSRQLRGFPDSQYHLGIMYENGWGVMKNLEIANYWLEKAKETK